MAPEIVMGEEATAASDVWSLGVVIHEIAFGVRPSWESQRGRRRLCPPARARLPRERLLFRLSEACLAEDASARPWDAGEVRRKLSRLLRPSLAPAFAASSVRP